jgi:hypothetical protein
LPETWTELEIDLIVADYFAKLIEELTGRPFSKAEHNRAHQGLLTDSPRSRGSIEFKHQNISDLMLNGFRTLKASYASAFPGAVDFR